jgi:hypothetical protein
MRAGPFSWKWVREHLILKESKAISPRRGGCGRIAVELNRVFVLVNESHDSPHLLRVRFDIQERAREDGTATIGHPRKLDEKQRLPPRWHDHVLSMGKVMWVELDRVNGFSRVDVGYSKDGPIVRALADAIPIITGEQPGRAAVARKLEQVLK